MTIIDHGKVMATADLTAEANGTVKVTVPALKRGIHVLVARFAGSSYNASTSHPDVVTAD